MSKINLEELSNYYYAALVNSDIEMPLRIVAFSAVNGSGKTTISKFLESKGFLNPDPAILRDIIRTNYTRDSDIINNTVLDFYRSPYAQKVKDLKNKSLVIDSNLDRNHDIFFANYTDICTKPFIIRIDLPIEENLSRLRKREAGRQETLDKIISNLPEYIEDHSKFGIKFKDRISYRITGDITKEILDDLYEKILEHQYN